MVFLWPATSAGHLKCWYSGMSARPGATYQAFVVINSIHAKESSKPGSG